MISRRCFEIQHMVFALRIRIHLFHQRSKRRATQLFEPRLLRRPGDVFLGAGKQCHAQAMVQADLALAAGCDAGLAALASISILPLKVAPSSSITLGETIFPLTLPVEVMVTFSTPLRSPVRVPRTVMVRAKALALITPCSPMVRLCCLR